jgi:hypothetical protein
LFRFATKESFDLGFAIDWNLLFLRRYAGIVSLMRGFARPTVQLWSKKRTTLRAEWTSDDGTLEKFFDYALKGTIKN